MNNQGMSGSGRGGRGPWQQPPPPQLQHQQQQPPPRQQMGVVSLAQQQQQQQQQQQRRAASSGGGPGRVTPSAGGPGRSTHPPVHTQSGVPFGHLPAYLPGSASLVEELDQRLLIVLRDGKHIIGTMISYDQFSNLILQDAVERRVLINSGICYYHDIPLGMYIVRGDSTVLMGQVDSTQEASAMKAVTLHDLDVMREQQEKTAKAETVWDFDSDLIA